MKIGLQPATSEARKLLMDGALAMAQMSRDGLRIDTAYLNKAITRTKKTIAKLEKQIDNSREMRNWVKWFGNNTKPGSRQQLGRVIFDACGYTRNPFLGKKNNEAAFEHLKKEVPFVENYFLVEKLKKMLSTNLYGIQKETVNGYLHPFFDLHTAESYRSSSSKPNFHNQPVRNKRVSEIVRTCVIPREGHVLLEADYSTMEVRGSYCYHKDPKLREDILTGDMHTDRAKDLFLLTDEELGPVNQDPGKTVRYIAKNKFVFAQFYGSVYFQCAPDLWDAISLYNLRRSDGVSLYQHLKEKGIKRLGLCLPDNEPKRTSYEYIVKAVEEKMWKDTYTVYDQWKRDWWSLYQQQGGVNLLTGFCLFGVFRRNQILCDPIQGVSFHCLLWSLIEIQKELRRRKAKSKVILQVHDSILLDVYKKELDMVIELVSDVMLKRVVKHYPWIQIPLAVEMELAEENWFSKKPMEIAA